MAKPNKEQIELYAAMMEAVAEFGTSKTKDLLDAIEAVTDYAARDVCLHEDTHRGGLIWEICDHCGMKWSDDRNPKPANAHEMPKAIQNAYDVLAKYGD